MRLSKSAGPGCQKVKKPDRRILLTTGCCRLTACLCRQRASQAIPAVDPCPELCLPAVQMSVPGWSPQLAQEPCWGWGCCTRGCVQGLLDFTAARAGRESHFHPSMQGWAADCLECYPRPGMEMSVLCHSSCTGMVQRYTNIYLYTHSFPFCSTEHFFVKLLFEVSSSMAA